MNIKRIIRIDTPVYQYVKHPRMYQWCIKRLKVLEIIEENEKGDMGFTDKFGKFINKLYNIDDTVTTDKEFINSIFDLWLVLKGYSRIQSAKAEIQEVLLHLWFVWAQKTELWSNEKRLEQQARIDTPDVRPIQHLFSKAKEEKKGFKLLK